MGLGGGWERWSSAGRSTVAFGWCIDAVALAQTRPRQLDAMGAVHDAIQNGIADRRVGDEFVPQKLQLKKADRFTLGCGSPLCTSL